MTKYRGSPAMKILSAIICCAVFTAACATLGSSDTRTSEPPLAPLREFIAYAPPPLNWKLSGSATERRQATWKLVVITGTPSWSEYWRPLMARAPAWLEVVIVDRPGFGASEPLAAITSIREQAQALSVLVRPSFPEQKIMLLGQSYGGPISALIAAENPEHVKVLILLSAYFGDRGPTIRRLHGAGTLAQGLLGRDMKNGLAELNGQSPQLPDAILALEGLTIPIISLHGLKDTFVPAQSAKRLAQSLRATYVELPEGDHFLNQCCISDVFNIVATARRLAE